MKVYTILCIQDGQKHVEVYTDKVKAEAHYEYATDNADDERDYFQMDTHDIDPQGADLSPVGSETADLQGNTPETAAAALQRLVEGLENMIEGERLQEADIPDDYQWLIHMIKSALRLL